MHCSLDFENCDLDRMMKRDMATPLFSPRLQGGYVYRDMYVRGKPLADVLRLVGWSMGSMGSGDGWRRSKPAVGVHAKVGSVALTSINSFR